MDSFELNKIAGGVLAAALTIFGTKTLYEMVVPHHPPAKPGYVIAAAKAAPATPAKPAEPFSFEKVKAEFAKAKVEDGQDLFKKCTACHTPAKDGRNGVGPNLFNIVGRKPASHPGFAYSEPMKAKSGEWTYEALAAFLNNPKGVVPETKMVFDGFKDPEDLANILAYLRTLSDKPVDLPK